MLKFRQNRENLTIAETRVKSIVGSCDRTCSFSLGICRCSEKS